MKKILILLGLTLSLSANAGLLWFGLGAASAGKPKPVKSDLEVQINQISVNLPQICYDTIYTSCWNQYNSPKKSFVVAPLKQQEIYSYFKNKGYNVSYNQNQLVFDFSKQYQMFLKHQQVFITYEFGIIFGIIILIIGFIARKKYNYYLKVKHIKSLYESNPSQIVFGDKYDKEKFEAHLKTYKLPLNWLVNLSNDNDYIFGITSYDGRAYGRIAYSGKMVDNLFSSKMKNEIMKRVHSRSNNV